MLRKMAIGIEAIIFYLVLLDSIGAVVVSLFCAKWYKKNYRGFWKHFPATKGWCIAYFILVLWIGFGLKRLSVI
jgi:hypothetical protein